MNIEVLVIAFVISYLGSIPPGTINITSMQLSMQRQRRAAFFFALATSLTEFIYAGITVRFSIFISERPLFTENFQIITGIAMLGLGVVNLLSRSNAKSFFTNTDLKGRNGFKKGVVLGLLNPLTIPFWLAVTAYLQNHYLLSLNEKNFWIYLIGIASGTFCLLLSVNKLGSRFTKIANNQIIVHRIPGALFVVLGLYHFIDWLFF